MYGDFGQILANHQMQRDQMRNKANIAAMKQNRSGASGDDDYAKMYSLGLQTAEMAYKLEQIEKANQKQRLDQFNATLSELAIARHNNDDARASVAWSKLMQDEEFATQVRQITGPVLDNGVPYRPGDPAVNVEVSNKAFNYFNNKGFIKTNAAKAEEETHARNLQLGQPAEEIDGRSVMGAPADNAVVNNYAGENDSDSIKSTFKTIGKGAALSKNEKIKAPTEGEVTMQDPEDVDANGYTTLEEDEAQWRNSAEYQQLVDKEKEMQGEFKPGDRLIDEETFLNAVETGDFSQIPPEYHTELKSYLAGVKIAGNPDGTYTIYSQVDIDNMLTQHKQQEMQAKENLDNYLTGLFNSKQGQEARIEEGQRGLEFKRQEAVNQNLDQGMEFAKQQHEGLMKAKPGSIQQANIQANSNKFNGQTFEPRDGFHQYQMSGGGGSDKNKEIGVSLETVGRQIGEKLGLKGNTFKEMVQDAINTGRLEELLNATHPETKEQFREIIRKNISPTSREKIAQSNDMLQMSNILSLDPSIFKDSRKKEAVTEDLSKIFGATGSRIITDIMLTKNENQRGAVLDFLQYIQYTDNRVTAYNNKEVLNRINKVISSGAMTARDVEILLTNYGNKINNVALGLNELGSNDVAATVYGMQAISQAQQIQQTAAAIRDMGAAKVEFNNILDIAVDEHGESLIYFKDKKGEMKSFNKRTGNIAPAIPVGHTK